MNRCGQMIRLKPSAAEEYVQFPSAVWPGVLEVIRKCNIINYSICLKDNYLFS